MRTGSPATNRSIQNRTHTRLIRNNNLPFDADDPPILPQAEPAKPVNNMWTEFGNVVHRGWATSNCRPNRQSERTRRAGLGTNGLAIRVCLAMVAQNACEAVVS